MVCVVQLQNLKISHTLDLLYIVSTWRGLQKSNTFLINNQKHLIYFKQLKLLNWWYYEKLFIFLILDALVSKETITNEITNSKVCISMSGY